MKFTAQYSKFTTHPSQNYKKLQISNSGKDHRKSNCPHQFRHIMLTWDLKCFHISLKTAFIPPLVQPPPIHIPLWIPRSGMVSQKFPYTHPSGRADHADEKVPNPYTFCSSWFSIHVVDCRGGQFCIYPFMKIWEVVIFDSLTVHTTYFLFYSISVRP